MKVYCVFQQGVYRHECGGVFSALRHAIDAADALAAGDRDSHHSYDVVEFELGVRCPTKPSRMYSPDIQEQEALYSVSKDTPKAQSSRRRREALYGRA